MSLGPNDCLSIPVKSSQPNEVAVGGTGGYGSAATKWRYFAAVYRNIGDAITYSGVGNGTVNGDSFTINRPGVYAISYFEQFGSGAWFGVSLNSNKPTTDLTSLSQPEWVAMVLTPGANQNGCASVTIFLNKGDVVRAHTNGTAPSGFGSQIQFRITKVTSD